MINLRITPAQLKKYGIYTVLSLSLSLNTYLVISDKKENREDIKYEREERQKLQQILIEQQFLKREQEILLKMQGLLPEEDTTKNI